MKTTTTKTRRAEKKGVLDRFEKSLPEGDKSKATKKAAKAKPATVKNLFGYSLTDVARWLGANGVNAEEWRAIFSPAEGALRRHHPHHGTERRPHRQVGGSPRR